jgi:hypothetical protein
MPDKPILPPEVGGGRGSEFGNYAAVAAGETTIKGARCVLFDWDRPLPDGNVIRLRSASCYRPDGIANAVELERHLVRLSDSPALLDVATAPN